MEPRLPKASLAFCLAFWILSHGIGLSAQQVVSPETTLRGLPGVAVKVASTKTAQSLSDLSLDAIQTDVELKLRLAGITVLQGQLAKNPSPELLVALNMMEDEHDHFSFGISVRLNQQVTLTNGLKAIATTWSTGFFGHVGPAHTRSVRDSIKDEVDVFLNAWLTANPK